MIVLLWSDVLIWLLVVASVVLGGLSWRNPPLRAAWRRLGRSRPGMAAATVLLAFVLVGLADSLHYRPRLENVDPGQPTVYAVEVLSALDAIAAPLRTRNEKTYSAPLATRAYAKESIELRDADGRVRTVRDFPRLKFGGIHLGENEAGRDAHAFQTVMSGVLLALVLVSGMSLGVAALLARRSGRPLGATWRGLWCGETDFAWNAVLLSLAALLLTLLPVLALCVDYHVFGTDKVGQDVFYQILKSVRTALVIGL